VSDEVSDLEPVKTSTITPSLLVIPILTMVLMIFVGLYITGDGDMMRGSGSTSVLWAVGIAIAVAMIQYAIPRKATGGKSILTPAQSTDLVLKGCAGLLPATILIVFAFALGQVSRALEMGPYLVSLIGTSTPAWWLAPLVFIVTCFVSFTLGSSWTAFAILIPIVLPLAEGMDLSPALMLGVVLSGGVYGDHASPLSDTSIISSMAAASDHVDHINTQLPYTLVLAGITTVLYAFLGLVMG